MPEANFVSFPSNQIDENQEHLREVLRPRYCFMPTAHDEKRGHWSYQDLITPSNICAIIMLTCGNEIIFMQESASGNTGYIPSKLPC